MTAAVVPPGESDALRRCVRDLVALSTLPAVWSSADTAQIAGDLVLAVARVVAADLVLVEVRDSAAPIVRAARGGAALEPAAAERTAAALQPWLASRGDDVRLVPDPEGGGALRLAVAPLGHATEAGVLAAAAARDGFPSETERLLLSVAANQAAVAVQRRQAEDALVRSQRELADFFDNATVALHLVGPDGTILRANQAELDMLGYSRDEYVGRHIAEFHVDRPVIDDLLRRLTGGETIVERDARLRCKDGSIRQVIIDSSGSWHEGQFVNTRCFTRDVTDRRRTEQTANFLAGASAVLAALSEPDDSLQGIARLAVPAFADWCWVDVPDRDRVLRRVALVHDDESRLELARRIGERYGPLPGDARGAAAVLHSGRAEWVPQVDDGHLAALARDAEHLSLLRQLGWRSLLAVPVRSRGSVLAVLSFATGESGRVLRDEELRVAEDLAGRTAVAVENASLLRALREADRRKDEFLAILAHELRNPLAPLRNAVEILRAKGPPVPELQWARSVIDRQAQQMGRLVDDLLDVSRISRGKIELRRERVALSTIVGTVLEASRPTIEKWGHQLTVVLPAEPLYVEADVVRIGQVLLNLLDNACKYTDRGGHISLTVEQGGEQAVIRVRDNGIGIPAEMLGSVFEMFIQVDRSLERAQGGLGIGLTLVHRLIALHGGSVEAHSAGPGRGSEFVVRLPLAPQPTASAEPAADEAQPLRRCRVLVVDDNRDSADSLALLLEMVGEEVAVAYDGEAALEKADSFQPEVVLLDLGLPKLNGFETARRLRRREGGAQPVLIALTGWGQEDDRRRSREAGFDFHLTKPVDFQTLKGLLARLGGTDVADDAGGSGETSTAARRWS